MELRGKTLRTHSGEVSFPGGRVDDTDKSFLYTALRETHEELGIHPRRVDVLGQLGPPEFNKTGDMRVWPFVGFVRPKHTEYELHRMAEDEPLPSIDLLSLHSELSPNEVAMAFHLPLATIVNPSNMRTRGFRDGRTYPAIDVTDIVSTSKGRRIGVTTESSQDLIGVTTDGKVEVWGLSGWYLALLMRTLRVYH